MNNPLNDLRYALRQLRKSPGFTLTAVLTVALGIGATTAIFSLVNAIVLRPLPFPEQGRLMWLAEGVEPNAAAAKGEHSTVPDPLSYPDFFDWRVKNHSLAGMASYRTDYFTLTGRGDARELTGVIVSSDFFHVLGVGPALGRGFLPSEEKRGAYAAVLSHQLWRSTFNSARDILGRNIVLGGNSYRVVGVMPKGFVFPIQHPAPALWVSLATDAAAANDPITAQRGAHMLSVIARLKPNVTLAQARADLSLIAHNLSIQYPDSEKKHEAAVVQPELEHLTGNSQPALRVLFGAVLLVLLIACVNVAGLLLARATRRRPEFAMRAALGASRPAIVRQMLVESVLLGCGGGALGLGLSVAMLRGLLHFVPENLPRMGQISVDGPVLAFTVCASVLTGLLFGVLPAWRMSRLDPALALRDGTRTVAGGRGQHRIHDSLVVTQTAIALVLLVGSGLLIRSFIRVLQVNPGFDPQHVLAASIDLPDSRYSELQQIQFYRDLLPRLAAQPGVQSAAAGWPLPLSGSQIGVGFDIQGHPSAPGEGPSSPLAVVTPGYFRTLHIPVLRGRAFRTSDDYKSPPVVVISQSFARKYFPGEDPIGKRMEPGIADDLTKKSMREIVGIVGDVKRLGLTAETVPQIYLPFAQAEFVPPTLVLRTSIDPVSLIGPLHAQLRAMDRNVPLYDVHTFDSMVGQSAAGPRFQMMLLTCFAAMALLLSAIGLYGVLSYMVAQRTLEIGVRMAMGAQRTSVLRLVLVRGLALALMGVAIGLGVALLLTRLMAGMLYGVHALDPITFVAVILVLLSVSLLASVIPARRAASIDPMRALRSE